MVAQGYQDLAISQALGLTYATVREYITRIAITQALGPGRDRRVMLTLAWFDRQSDGRTQE